MHSDWPTLCDVPAPRPLGPYRMRQESGSGSGYQKGGIIHIFTIVSKALLHIIWYATCPISAVKTQCLQFIKPFLDARPSHLLLSWLGTHPDLHLPGSCSAPRSQSGHPILSLFFRAHVINDSHHCMLCCLMSVSPLGYKLHKNRHGVWSSTFSALPSRSIALSTYL